MGYLRLRRYAALLASAASLAGCSGMGSAEGDGVREAAQAFTAAVGQDTAAACDLLSPATVEQLEDEEGPCPSALTSLGLPDASEIASVEVYGKDAMVELAADTLFLARFGDGWKVTAAGCRTDGKDRPYTCALRGN